MKRENLLKTADSIIDLKDSPVNTYFASVFNLFIYKKSLRINEAVYLVTSHIMDKENIKFDVRESALKLSLLSVRFNNAIEDRELSVLYKSFLSTIVELTTLLEVLFVSGFIKESNFNLISKELANLYEDIRNKTGNFQNLITPIKQAFFNVNLNDLDRNIKDKSYIKDSNLKDIIVKDSDNLQVNNSKNNNETEIKNNSFKMSNLIEKKDRRLKIMSFFVDGKKLTIKDVAILLPEYGDKTIQRELLAMVKNGDLGKEGEKRWTVYFLLKK